MKISTIIEDLELMLRGMQRKLDVLRTMDRGLEYDLDILMTRKEAADFLCCSVRNVDRLVAKGRLVKVIDKGCVRIRRSSLLRYKGYILEERTDFCDPIIIDGKSFRNYAGQ